MIKFHSPIFALLFIPILLFFFRVLFFEGSFFPSIKFSFMKPIVTGGKKRHVPISFYMKLLALILTVIALMRPQRVNEFKDIITEGIDIVITLDISGSMQAMDFKPDNRLEVAKKVIKSFIEGRKSDRIGLVIFAAKAITLCPLTIDYDVILRFLKDVHTGMLPDGTAIGDALGVSVNRIKSGKGKSKVIILLTDGVNNTGQISPITAAQLAKKFGIRVYSIGVGTNGMAPIYVKNPYTGRKTLTYMKVKIDENLLKNISHMTGGRYFRATDTEALKEIFKRINSLEKSKVKVRSYYEYRELFYIPLLFAIFFLILSFLVGDVFLKNFE